MDYEGWTSRQVWEVALNIDNNKQALDITVEIRANHPNLLAFKNVMPGVYRRIIKLPFPRLNDEEWQEIYDHYFAKLADVRGKIVNCGKCGKEFNHFYSHGYADGKFYCSEECFNGR